MTKQTIKRWLQTKMADHLDDMERRLTLADLASLGDPGAKQRDVAKVKAMMAEWSQRLRGAK